MTTTDKIMDSSLFSWNIGAINGFAGKRADKFSANRDTIEKVGSSYGGTVKTIEDAASKSGKKYGLFSSKARKKANAAIADAKAKQKAAKEAADDPEGEAADDPEAAADDQEGEAPEGEADDQDDNEDQEGEDNDDTEDDK